MSSAPPTESLNDILDTAGDTLYGLNHHPSTIQALVEALANHETPPTTHLLAKKRTFNDAFDPFWVGATASDLIATDTLHCHLSESGHAPIFVSDAGIESVVFATPITELPGTDSVDAANIPIVRITGNGETPSEALDVLSEVITETEPYELYTPPLSDTLDAMENHFNTEIRETFRRGIKHVYLHDSQADYVYVPTLVAAMYDLQYYDLGLWAEMSEFSSKTTLSRAKTPLEEQDIITTEPSETPQRRTPQGRPRQKLTLTEEYTPIDDITTLLDSVE
ncbi:transcriptional regulator TbsP domain-containing protein [Salinibaculum rarum]|uniref:transcriptional regulator TbsP domain-containing protein n=1 Tax=Salinibaculum rarum TaxID=3058903 RepID=UPI00265F45B9|nr:DUF5821 family protein [Salinibaculum sp. KK48]